jgi:uncharacterized protein
MDNDNFNIENPQPEEPEKNETGKLKPRISPVGAAFMALFLIFILYQGMGGILTVVVLGFDLEKMDPSLLRLMTIAGQMLFILLPTLILAKVLYVDVSAVIRFKYPRAKEAGLFFIGFFIVLPLMQNLSYLQSLVIDKLAAANSIVHQIKDFFDSMDKYVGVSYTSLFSVKSVFDVIIIVVAVSVTPAVCEEIFFRGFIQKSFELKWKPFMSIAVTSIVFAVYHFNPYGFIPLVLLSAFLGYAAYKSGSIFIPMSIHFANNFIMIILYFVVGVQAVDSKPLPEVQISSYLIMLFFNVIALCVWIYFVQKFYKKTETN